MKFMEHLLHPIVRTNLGAEDRRYNMKNEFHLVTPFVDGKWQRDVLVEGRPFGAMRRILGGSWDRASGDIDRDMAMAAFRGERKVMVLRFPNGTDRAKAEAALKELEVES